MERRNYQFAVDEAVAVRDPFWGRYSKLIKEQVIPYQWNILNDRIPDAKPSHVIDNFKIAAGEMDGSFFGQVFQDSDLYKWLEAVGNILRLYPDRELEERADEVIALIGRAQEADGYLNTYFQTEAPDRKWTDVLECHELYCAGHLMEAAAAYYRTTGKTQILDIASRLADQIGTVFGPEEGKLHGYPGHQEIELGLLKLQDATGQESYGRLAQYFIDARGTNGFFEEEFERRKHICFWTNAPEEEPNRRYNQFPYTYYNQFHAPVREQKDAAGHAVRAVYMYTAMADLAARSGEEKLQQSCRLLWDSIVNRQMYITGGIGATPSGEAFTVDYDLPNDTNYAETCASIGLIFFAQRMLLMEADSTYGDTIERALYNTVLGGMSLDGTRFFYVNPLEVVPENCEGNTERSHVKPVRQKWFACACCPPNIARLLSSLHNYIYSYRDHTVLVHLYIGSEVRLTLAGKGVTIRQSGNYPWDGTIRMEVEPDSAGEFTLAFRIPGWCRKMTLSVNGRKTPSEKLFEEAKAGYYHLTRQWAKGDVVELCMNMPVERMQAHAAVSYDGGRVAIERGPLIYCLEETDNGKYLSQLSLKEEPGLVSVYDETLLGGCVTVEGAGVRRHRKENRLYDFYQNEKIEMNLKAVPYFLWNNRNPGEMQVWVAQE